MPDWWRDAMRNILIGLAAAISALGASVMALQAQAPARNVWDGVFTADQAAQGKALFETKCAICHGAELNGAEMAPPLAGGRFLGKPTRPARGGPVHPLPPTMPPSRPRTLPPAG